MKNDCEWTTGYKIQPQHRNVSKINHISDKHLYADFN